MTAVRLKFTQSFLNPRHVWGRLLVLLIPVAVLGVWLKALRIGSFFPDAGIAETLTKLLSDVSFGAAWVLLWLLVCWLTSGAARTVAFYLAHMATLVVGIFTVVNHEFAIRTGKPLTWEEMSYAWRQQGQLSSLLGSQVSNSAIALLIGVVLGTLLLPPILGPQVSRLLNR